MKIQILTAFITGSLVFISNSAYSATPKSSGTDNMRMQQHRSQMQTQMKNMHNTEQWNKIMSDTMLNAQNLINMGAKVVKDGNFTNNSERMIMGAKMMISGIKILDKHKEHQMMSNKKAVTMTQEKHMALLKNIDESSELIMLMANKLIKDGNTANDIQKMMSGSELLKTGMKLHHSMMPDDDKHDMHHKKMKKNK